MHKLTMITISVGTGVPDGPETMGVDVLYGDVKPFDCMEILFLKTFIPLARTVGDAGPYGLGWTPFCHIKQTDKSKFETFSMGGASFRSLRSLQICFANVAAVPGRRPLPGLCVAEKLGFSGDLTASVSLPPGGRWRP